MAKPRIIIADTDSDYINPLQAQFVKEFFERVDLEFISDPDYFERAFSTPRKADVLVVSEDLYDPSLQRHPIGKIFLMTEQNEEGQTAELNINRIFKYTSIKEIFNEIIGKSASALREDPNSRADPQIVLVYSASGGAGKTTIAFGLAAGLTMNYKKVLYINASCMQSFQRMLENPSTIGGSTSIAMLAGGGEPDYGKIRQLFRKELFTYLPPFNASLMALGLEYSVYERLALAAKRSRDFDFIIVDADTEFDEGKASLINTADKVVIVTRQTAASVYATDLLVANLDGVTPEKYIFICNDFSAEESNALYSPNANLRFSINDYVAHIPQYDSLKAQTFSQVSGLQRISFLLL